MEQKKFSKIYIIIGLVMLFLFIQCGYTIFLRRSSLYSQKKLQTLKEDSEIKKIGNIYDTNGKLLAKTVYSTSIYIDPKFLRDIDYVISELSSQLGISQNWLRNKIQKGIEEKRRFIWIKRYITSAKVIDEIRKFSLPGVYFRDEAKRIYPYNELLSHLLGFRGVDSIALDGAEYSLDNILSAKDDQKKYLLVDGRRNRLFISEKELVDWIDFEKNLTSNASYNKSSDVYLSVDLNIQHIVSRIIDEVQDKWQPKAITCIVLDPFTGKILALENRPKYDPNHYYANGSEAIGNRAIISPLEPGSTFKPIILAQLLTHRLARLDEKVYCEQGHFRLNHRLLTDHVPHGWLSVIDVIAKSSNIGIIKLAMRMDKNLYLDVIKKFGFFSRTGVELPGENKGRITDFSKWNYYTLSSIPMGYEILVTPMQMARAFSAFANGGYLLPITLLKHKEVKMQERILREDVYKKVLEALKEVVNSGTGVKAKSHLYTIAGKTGTAKKIDKTSKRYTKRYESYFIGFSPADSPKILVYLNVSEPKGAYFGGTVCAPAVKNIIERVLYYLNVPPEEVSHTLE